jgi:polyisoprenoid-binding protein YceI
MKNAKTHTCTRLALLACLALPAAARPDPGEEYRVLPEESEVHVLVFRAGALGRLGHNHVVTARDVTGRVLVAEAPAESTFELTIPVETLVVDDPEARAAAGSAFEGEVSDDDRAGTRRNMLGERLLDAARHPQVHVRSTAVRGEFDDLRVSVEMDVRGAQRDLELPVSVLFYDDRLVATGSARLSHGDLGLTPFTAGIGTLRVADELMFRYRIVAKRDAPRAASRRQRALAVVQHDDAALAHRAPE